MYSIFPQARATLAHEEKNIPLLMSATKALVSAAKQQAIVSVVGDLDMKECNIQEAYLKLANQYEKQEAFERWHNYDL